MDFSPPLILILIATLIFPPIGVFTIAGCGPDLLINIILTLLGYFPGHIHAFYLIYIFYDHREQATRGFPVSEDAPFVFSDEVQSGGVRGTKGLMAGEVLGKGDQDGLKS